MPNKRGNGEGTISRRKNGNWCAAVTIGRNTDGSLKRKFIYGKTRLEVAKRMTELQNEVIKNSYFEPTKMTFGEWLDTWLNEYKKPEIRLSTYVSYEMLIRQHIKPILGNLLIKELRPENLQKLYNEKSSGGRADGEKGGLSPKTVRNIHNIIHDALDQAVKNQLIIRNVSEATTLPRRTKNEMRVLTVEEQQKFMQIIEGDAWSAAFFLDLASGLRLGELLALRWKDVDLKEGIIKVRQSLNRLKNLDAKDGRKTQIVFQEPKTAKGTRNIPIPESIVEKLKIHQANQEKEKEKHDTNYNKDNLVFCSNVGTHIEPRSFIRKLHRLVKEAGIEHANVHSMRHTFASRSLELGIHPKIVQEMLGHANISMTLDTYSHVMPEMKKDAAAKLNSLFNCNKDATDSEKDKSKS